MATIQRSIEVNVPVEALYQQLTRFQDYPQFMDNVENAQQTDDTHLHWTTKMGNSPVEWDAEITEQETGRCIAWSNASGFGSAGKIEVQALNTQTSKATFTIDAAPGGFPGLMAGDTEQEMSRHLSESLEKLKDFMEASDPEKAARRAEQASVLVPATSLAGSPTEVLEDEPDEEGPGGR